MRESASNLCVTSTSAESDGEITGWQHEAAPASQRDLISDCGGEIRVKEKKQTKVFTSEKQLNLAEKDTLKNSAPPAGEKHSKISV